MKTPILVVAALLALAAPLAYFATAADSGAPTSAAETAAEGADARQVAADEPAAAAPNGWLRVRIEHEGLPDASHVTIESPAQSHFFLLPAQAGTYVFTFEVPRDTWRATLSSLFYTGSTAIDLRECASGKGELAMATTFEATSMRIDVEKPLCLE